MKSNITSAQFSRPLSAHLFGLLWFINLCSPYLNVALNRPDTPSLIYVIIIASMLLSLFAYQSSIKVYFPQAVLASGIYLAYTALSAMTWGVRQESWGFLVQGGSVALALMIFRSAREYRIILSWITFGMTGFGAFLVWQSVTGYKPPWIPTINFLHEIGAFIRAGEGFGEKNYSASLLVLGLTIAWAMAAYEQIPRRVAQAALLACTLGILFTFSRGAFIALAIVLACYGFTSIQNLRKLALAGMATIAVTPFFLGDIFNLFLGRFSVADEQDFIQAYSRWEQILGSLDILSKSSIEELIFGRGPFVYINEIIIHNTPLGILTEQGALGLALWLTLILVITHSSLKEFRRGNPYPLMAVSGFLTASMLIRIEVERIFWIMLFFLCASPKLVNHTRQCSNQQVTRQCSASAPSPPSLRSSV